jgi:bacterioferritin-associated ferredoxin
MDMSKCHCTGVKFEEIAKESKHRDCSYQEIACEKGAGEICTACKGDMKKYCEKDTTSQLQLLGVL